MSRRVSEVVSVGTSATKVMSQGAGKIMKLKKVWAYNSGGSAATFNFCDSGGTAKTPSISVNAGSHVVIGELDLPEYTFESDIYAVASASGISLMIEVEE